MNYEIEQSDRKAGTTMINEYLRRYAANAPSQASREHLDDDALNAFVESATSEREGESIVQHLTACSECRRNTAQLLRLLDELGEPESAVEKSYAQQTVEPGRVKQLLESLRAKIFPVTDTDSVLAYQAREDEESKKDEHPANEELK